MATYTQTQNTDPTRAVYGEQSQGVAALQQQLNQQYAGQPGYIPLVVDGKYGNLTRAAATRTAPATTNTTSVSNTANNEPTIGNSYGDFTNYGPSPQDSFYDQYGNDLRTTATQAVDPEKIKSDKLAEFQAQIDATKQIYAQKLKEAKNAGMGRLGSARAGQARGGLLGSDFSSSQNDTIGTYNADIESGINAEMNAAINDLMNQSRSAATAEIAAKTKAKQEGADAYIKFLGEKEERRSSGISSLGKLLVSKGIDITKLNPEQLATLKKNYNATDAEIQSAFDSASADKSRTDLETRKTTADINQTETQTAMINKKFEEDKRQFGLEYALKQKQFALDQQKVNQDANSANSKEVQGWVDLINKGQASITNVPANLRSSVASGLSASGIPAKNADLVKNALVGVANLLDKANKTGAVGFGSVFGTLPGTKDRDFVTQFDNVKALLSLDNLKLLKGTGSISDAEQLLLQQAATRLNRSQSRDEFIKTLGELQSNLGKGLQTSSNNAGGTTLMIGPDNLQYNVPNDQVESFKRDGGRLAQ